MFATTTTTTARSDGNRYLLCKQLNVIKAKQCQCKWNEWETRWGVRRDSYIWTSDNGSTVVKTKIEPSKSTLVHFVLRLNMHLKRTEMIVRVKWRRAENKFDGRFHFDWRHVVRSMDVFFIVLHNHSTNNEKEKRGKKHLSASFVLFASLHFNVFILLISGHLVHYNV